LPHRGVIVGARRLAADLSDDEILTRLLVLTLEHTGRG
jgi:hypothetical protein